MIYIYIYTYTWEYIYPYAYRVLIISIIIGATDVVFGSKKHGKQNMLII